MRYLISITLLSIILTSCGGKKQKGVDPSTGLTGEQYEMIKAINDSFKELDAAVALGVSGKATDPNQKVGKLAEMIQKAGCREDGKSAPTEDYKNNWNAAYTLGSGTACPVQISKIWDYKTDSSARSWRYAHKLDIPDTSFRDESIVESFAVHQGELSVRSSGAQQRVDGKLSYSNFVVKGQGVMTASLGVGAIYTGGRSGGGTITFQINSPRSDLRTKVIITYHSSRSTAYRINGYNVDRSVVDDLFSSFGLLEIKARAENMLY